MPVPIYIALGALYVIIFILLRTRKAIIAQKVIEKRRSEDRKNMVELAKNFIGKECLIYSFDGSHQICGTVKEVTDGALLIENKGNVEAVNLDFVMRIREYPRDKKGKKKSVVLD